MDWRYRWCGVHNRRSLRRADAPPAPPVDPSGPPLFAALREQRGLKLEPAKQRVDILVVDHAEHPTEN